MAILTDPNVPASEDRVLQKRYRILGTTDDIADNLEDAIKKANYHASTHNKRVYVVKVIGYAQPTRPPITYNSVE